MTYRHSICLALLFAVITMLIFTPPPLSAGVTTRVSVASDGTQGNYESGYCSISADGRFVAFHSGASNLVDGDTNLSLDVFVHDRQTGLTDRVSVASDGTEGEYDSRLPSISADGRFVAFQSHANNLVSGAGGTYHVYVHDRLTGETTLVSISSEGDVANNWSECPSISADGRFVAFSSFASNLVPGDTNDNGDYDPWGIDIFVHDRLMGETSRVSIASDGTQANYDSLYPAISADGRFVAFQSAASNLVEGDTNETVDVFVHDRLTGQSSVVSKSSDGVLGDGHSYSASISSGGMLVAFESQAENLVPGVAYLGEDIFVHDRQTGRTTAISLASNGEFADANCYSPSITADGRYVAFYSSASDLAFGDTNGYSDIFMHDRQTGVTERVSVASNGTQGNNHSCDPSISGDGRFVAFYSDASNLVPGDTNGHADIFVHDRWATGSAPPIPPETSVTADDPYTAPPGQSPTNLNRLKCQMHAHWFCDFSDLGMKYCDDHTITPSVLMGGYSWLGYDFICITEHNHSTETPEYADIFSLDYCSEVTRYGEPLYHLLAIGTHHGTTYGADILFADAGELRNSRWDDGLEIHEVPYKEPYTSACAPQEMVDRIRAMGGLAFIPHPDQMGLISGWWDSTKNFTSEEVMRLGSIKGIAIRTAGCHEDALGLWDKLLRHGYGVFANWKNIPILGYAEDDYTPGVPGANAVAGSTWVLVDAYYPPDASREEVQSAVKSALSSGRFISYWTNKGIPWISASYPKLRISVNTSGCRPVVKAETEGGELLTVIQFIGKENLWQSGVLHQAVLTNRAEYTCDGNETYVRVQCEYWSPFGKLYIASQPIWVYPTGQVAGPYTSAQAKQPVKSSQGIMMAASPELILEYVVPDGYPAIAPPQGYVGFVYNVTTADHIIPAGVVLSLSYAGQDIQAVGIDNLSVFHYDEIAQEWAALPSTIDKMNLMVETPISEEGIYTLSADLPEDLQAPAITIVTPLEGTVVLGQAQAACQIADNIGVLRAEFFLNDVQVGSDIDGGNGWLCEFDTTPYVSGQYTLKVVAEDASGNKAETTRSFFIESTVLPPTVVITSPESGGSMAGLFTVAGTCQDDEAAAEVWLFVDEQFAGVGTVDGTTWTGLLDTQQFVNGAKILTAVVKDYHGNSGTDSRTVSFQNPTFSISGKVDLQSFVGDESTIPITVQLRKTDGTATSRTVRLDSAGAFALHDVPEGAYALAFKASHWLRKAAPSIIVGPNAYNFNISLINGDCNGDNKVGAADLAAVRKAYGTTPGGAKWNPNADLNGDGRVGSADLAIVRRNYGKRGDPAVPLSIEVKAVPQGLAEGQRACTLMLRVLVAGTNNLLAENTVSLGSNGSGTIGLGLPAGTYDVWAKEHIRLARRVNGWAFKPDNPGILDFGTLLAGDCNNDNAVNQPDVDYLQSVWRTADPLADFNRDGIVNTIDFSLLNSNWNITGE